MNIRFADDIPSVFPPILLFAGVALTVLSSIQIDQSWRHDGFRTPIVNVEPKATELAKIKPLTKKIAVVDSPEKKKEAIALPDDEVNHQKPSETGKKETPPANQPEKIKDCNQHLTFNFSKNLRLASSVSSQTAALGDWMKSHPKATVVVRGHADDSGSEAFNLRLSRRRAQKIATILEKNGIQRKRIKVKAFGEYLPNELMSESSLLQRRVVVETLSSCKEGNL